MSDMLEQTGPMATPADLSLWHLFSMADVFVKFIMLLLIVMSVVSWTIWFAKGMQIRRLQKQARKFEEAYFETGQAKELYRNVRLDEAEHPFARVYVAGQEAMPKLVAGSRSIGEKIERLRRQLGTLMTRELEAVENGLTTLATIGSTAPFIGLLGTVWGIMNAFIGIGASKNTSLAVVAPGIAEALLATALGLFAAIPAVVAYNRLAGKLGRYSGRLEAFSSDYLGDLEVELSQPAKKGD